MKPSIDGYTLDELDSLLKQHQRDLCPLGCIFCNEELIIFSYGGIELVLDQMKDIHYKTHSKMINYPLRDCEYCKAEAILNRLEKERGGGKKNAN